MYLKNTIILYCLLLFCITLAFGDINETAGKLKTRESFAKLRSGIKNVRKRLNTRKLVTATEAPQSDTSSFHDTITRPQSDVDTSSIAISVTETGSRPQMEIGESSHLNISNDDPNKTSHSQVHEVEITDPAEDDEDFAAINKPLRTYYVGITSSDEGLAKTDKRLKGKEKDDGTLNVVGSSLNSENNHFPKLITQKPFKPKQNGESNYDEINDDASYTNPIEEDDMRGAFKLLDKNNVGFISCEDLNQVLKLLGNQLSEEEIELMKNKYKDSDGKVPYEEFKKFLMSSGNADETKETFDRIDSDNDGFVTAEELYSFYSSSFGDKFTLEEAEEIVKSFGVEDSKKLDFKGFLKFNTDGI